MANDNDMKDKPNPHHVRLIFSGRDLEILNELREYFRIDIAKDLIHYLLAEKSRELKEKAGKKE